MNPYMEALKEKIYSGKLLLSFGQLGIDTQLISDGEPIHDLLTSLTVHVDIDSPETKVTMGNRVAEGPRTIDRRGDRITYEGYLLTEEQYQRAREAGVL